MRDGEPSATARSVAMVRATMERPVTAYGDGDIERRLVERFPSRRRSPMAEVLERRTRWFDRVTLDAIESGVGQIVIVAAGYDCRALRFRTPGVRFIELDHPVTQSDKQRILMQLGADTSEVAYAAADFTVDDVGAALAHAGHDNAQASLYLVEGLLIYLDQTTIVSLLTALRSRATDDSHMAVSISRNQSAMFYARVASLGERAQSTFSEAEASALLQRCGWKGDTSHGAVLASPC